MTVETGLSHAARQMTTSSIRSFDQVEDLKASNTSGSSLSREVIGAIANFVNTAVGAGVIAVPYALEKTGFFIGLVLIVVAASLIYQGSCYLIKCGLKTSTLDYSNIMEVAFGNAGYYAFGIVVCLFLYGVLVAYLVIISDNWPSFAKDINLGHFFEHRTLSTIFFAFFALPLSLIKDMQKLSWASCIGFISVIVIDVIIIAYAPSSAKAHPYTTDEILTVVNPRTLFSGVGIISFSMVSQHASYLIYNSIQKCTYERWKLVSGVSIFIEVLFVISIGVAGYLSFGNGIHADILDCYHGDIVVNMGRVLLTILMVATYPMVMFVLRHIFDQMVFEKLLGCGPRTELRHYLVTLGLWVATVALAIFVSDLGTVLGLTGSIGESSLAYLFPALLYVKLYKDEMLASFKKLYDHRYSDTETFVSKLKVMKDLAIPLAMIIFAVISMVAGAISSVI